MQDRNRRTFELRLLSLQEVLHEKEEEIPMIVLRNSTGNQQVDSILRGLISLYEMVFPEHIRGYYLLGSYMDASAGAISDIDLYIVFKQGFLNLDEEKKADDLREASALLSPIRLDIPLLSEEQLQPEDVRLKVASRLMYGEDIRDKLPLPTKETYHRYITQWPLHFFRRIHQREVLHFPLHYPQPDGPFYGYTTITIPPWYPPLIQQGTKEFVAAACWTATALVALQAGQYVGKKADAIKVYAELIADEWTTFLQDVYIQCDRQWEYRVPDEMSDRVVLERLCRRMIAFENHYLSIYKAYLLQQLQGSERDAILFATKQLQEVIYPDQEVVNLLHALKDEHDAELQQAMRQALQTIESIQR